MPAAPKHLLFLEGGSALPAFRAEALQKRLAQANPRIVGLSARHVHWVWSDAPLNPADRDKLAALLQYGEPASGALDEGALVCVIEGMCEEKVRPIGREGTAASHWVLVDFGVVVVHIFTPPEREYYSLEKHWAEARTVLRVQ